MKKIVAVLPLILLGACSMFQNDGTRYEDEFYDEETGLVIEGENETGNNVAELQPSQEEQPVQGTNYQQTQNRPQSVNGQAVLSADGTVIELPAQQIYIGDIMGNGQERTVAPQEQNRPYALSYSQPIQRGQTEPRVAQPTVITLQNREYPNTFAQCVSTDNACITAYEAQGYMHVQNLPQFAGYQEVPASSDYPQGSRWRNNNNIPRW